MAGVNLKNAHRANIDILTCAIELSYIQIHTIYLHYAGLSVGIGAQSTVAAYDHGFVFSSAFAFTRAFRWESWKRNQIFRWRDKRLWIREIIIITTNCICTYYFFSFLQFFFFIFHFHRVNKYWNNLLLLRRFFLLLSFLPCFVRLSNFSDALHTLIYVTFLMLNELDGWLFLSSYCCACTLKV